MDNNIPLAPVDSKWVYAMAFKSGPW